LREGKEAEYERQHVEVWPEILQAIKDSGIRNYSIYRYQRWLFSYFELPPGRSIEEIGARLAKNEACLRWETLMQNLQEPLPESGENNWWVPMKEVFHLE
jgi:L-rhamnose mutarotase